MTVDSFDKTRFRFIAGGPPWLFQEIELGWRGDILPCHLIAQCNLVNCGINILCGCWHFWQNKIQVNCWMSFIIIAGNRIRGEGWCLAISFDCSAWNWDSSLVNFGTNILHGCWLFWLIEIQDCCWNLFNIVEWNRIGGGWCLAISFDQVPYCLWILCGKNRGESNKVSLPHNLCHVVFDDSCFIWFGMMLVLEKNLSWQKRMKWVNTTIHMGIPHHAVSVHWIQILTCVLVFEYFLSYCCSDPLGIEALFEPHSWLDVLVILLVSKTLCMEGSFGLGEFLWKALLFWYFCLLSFDWGWKEAGLVVYETQHHLQEPHCSYLLSHVLPHLP